MPVGRTGHEDSWAWYARAPDDDDPEDPRSFEPMENLEHWSRCAAMCGIAGYLYSDPLRPATLERLQPMTDVLGHRGPDGDTHYLQRNLALGHRRLSIIDLDTGDQPMTSRSGDTVVIQNGEIYNYLELRSELESLGRVFRTRSDTEVILEAYEEWGLDFQTRLNGMWAFALWDERRRRLVLSRDRLGEKPLHYSDTPEGIVFASEMKSLFAFGVPREKDLRWIEVFACLGYLPAPHSFFKQVRKLPAGSCLIQNEGQKPRVESYWDLPAIDERNMLSNRAEVSSRFEELLTDSVRIRMRADVPFGAFLSGGLDSGSIVALMSDLGTHPPQTFTIGFEPREFDERDLARAVSERFDTTHKEQQVDPDVFEESLLRVLHHFDEPFGDASAIPTGIVSRLAREQVKMVLSGDGGDEAMSGYTIYQGEKFAQTFQRIPSPARRAVPHLLRALAGGTRGSVRYRLNRARNVVEASNRRFLDRLIQKSSWSPPSLIKNLLGGYESPVPIEEFLSDAMHACPYEDGFYRLMYFNLKISLPDDMLVKVDRMSMAHSLEVRAPFLDHRLIEYMVGVDKNLKLRGYQRKAILRETVGKRLPPEILEAPKKGFAVPIREWFKDDGFEKYVRELSAQSGLVLDDGELNRIVRENQSGAEDHGNSLWILMLLNRFLQD